MSGEYILLDMSGREFFMLIFTRHCLYSAFINVLVLCSLRMRSLVIPATLIGAALICQCVLT